MKLFAGIEGGASFSKVVLLDERGKILARLDNEPSTNVWLMTKSEWVQRIHGMTVKALGQISGAKRESYQLEALGLCLSGCENSEENQELCELLKSKFPDLCKHYAIASDTVGSIMTCCPDGGIVLIAGTGSNSLLIYPNGSSVRCGGWGHLIGDHGSAYWIAARMIRYLIEHEENFHPIPYDVELAKKAVFEHFKIDSYIDLLKPLYHEFDKSFIAKLCARLAKLAIEQNDPLSKKVFQEAGEVLATHVKALLPKSENDQLSVICVGSVFKSWPLLEQSFLAKIADCPKRIDMGYLTETSAIGAANFAAKHLSTQLPIDYEKNFKILGRYQDGKRID